MEKSAKFWNKLAERYSKSPVADESAYQKKLQVTRDYFRPDMRILEFGCGTGSTAISHSPFVKHIQAIDYSSKMIDIAQSKADIENVKNITFVCTTFDEIAALDQTYDAVLGLNVLHLMHHWKEVIGRVYDMLTPGGIFVTSTICVGNMGIFGKILKIALTAGAFLGFLPVIEIFRVEELKTSLIRTGFNIDYSWQPGRNKAVFIVAKKPS